MADEENPADAEATPTPKPPPEGKPLDPDSEEVLASGKTVSATYRFKGANPKAKGWGLVYVVPGPLVEVTVPFKLENIPLP